MGLLIITLVLIIICISMYETIEKTDKLKKIAKDDLCIIISVVLVISIIVAIVMIGMISINAATTKSYEQTLNAERDVILNEYESQLYYNDNNLGYHEAMESVKDWNVKVTMGKTYSNNFLFKGLVSNAWNKVDLIELDSSF